ncbi:MAG: exodeoxyribonuclease small subunit [Candidatus Sumerlaeota bacterium]|nr:exodeoxyribonuclease small subunit [Candidatus Sumerlaeota bacterium]
MPPRKKDEQPLEKSLEKLEEIVARLESGEVPLEKSIGLYEEGRKLGTDCLARLEGLERRVQLVREGADGKLETEEFENQEED